MVGNSEALSTFSVFHLGIKVGKMRSRLRYQFHHYLFLLYTPPYTSYIDFLKYWDYRMLWSGKQNWWLKRTHTVSQSHFEIIQVMVYKIIRDVLLKGKLQYIKAWGTHRRFLWNRGKCRHIYWILAMCGKSVLVTLTSIILTTTHFIDKHLD